MGLTDEPEELLDLVDQNDKKIGTIRREETIRLSGLKPPHVRVSELFIVNDEGKIWIPRRAAHKKIAPNGLDFSTAEHVQSGETYEQAIVRGLREEVRMDVTPVRVKLLGVLPPFGTVYCFRATFVMQSNETPDYNPDDFTSAEWMSPSDLKQRLMSGEASKDTLLPALDLFLSYNKKGKE